MPHYKPTHLQNIVGRFAPSPTGPLHFGSLIAATASYLCARNHPNSRWLLRIEDLDTQRTHQHHTQSIIKTLEQFGFKWDDEILYQNNRTQVYQDALDLLKDVTYPCSCTRKFLISKVSSSDKSNPIYPGYCRNGLNKPNSINRSIRLKTDTSKICFTDMFQGDFCQNIFKNVGDFIVKRTDDTFAYQLAVVVDDAAQGVNQIIRGADLLDNTPRQIYLQELLNYKTPKYGHVPVAVTSDGRKLSKQSFAPEISTNNKRALIIQSLIFLGQTPPVLDDFSNLDDLWTFAVQNWDQTKIPKVLTQTCTLPYEKT